MMGVARSGTERSLSQSLLLLSPTSPRKSHFSPFSARNKINKCRSGSKFALCQIEFATQLGRRGPWTILPSLWRCSHLCAYFPSHHRRPGHDRKPQMLAQIERRWGVLAACSPRCLTRPHVMCRRVTDDETACWKRRGKSCWVRSRCTWTKWASDSTTFSRGVSVGGFLASGRSSAAGGPRRSGT